MDLSEGCEGRSLIQVYTGNGKGKSTAAWGLALRSVGRGLKTVMVQFLKPSPSGERIAAARLAPELEVLGETSAYDVCADQRHSVQLREDCIRNFETARRLILSGEYDLVILDELNIVLFYEFLSPEDVLPALAGRPDRTEVVITGRYAPKWLIGAADLVTEMREIKHPCNDGVQARKGIEY